MFPASSNKKKSGVSITFPDVCKTPAPPAPFVPIPYPNIEIASSKMKVSSVKVRNFGKNFEKSKGNDAGTLKGIMASVNKIASIFAKHSSTVKATGKQVTKPMMPNKAVKVFQQAQKQQKTFEKQLKKECDNLLKACKGNKDQEKIAKSLVAMVGSAARGHPI
ncbi:PAAR-like domain-containing protein [Marimonas sp. MJW-29]|uniref:PAAR-like domain-containing protein n=1 Tax=Sulfitobacter sediminis TaxID=3234186 RepID=A0ABV3RHJ6_9RHOB